ncbi:MAG: hypothetical protein O3B08_00965 [Proteobacteria bacterium]|jgi:hypothetical protein|nr:hypothetical protein [Pseudomonadota bacterium]
MIGSAVDAAGGAVFENAQSGSVLPLSRHNSLMAWLTAAMATSLVLSELLTVDGTLVWALGRTLHLGIETQVLFGGIGLVVSLWLSFLFFRVALRYERDPARQD